MHVAHGGPFRNIQKPRYLRIIQALDRPQKQTRPGRFLHFGERLQDAVDAIRMS